MESRAHPTTLSPRSPATPIPSYPYLPTPSLSRRTTAEASTSQFPVSVDALNEEEYLYQDVNVEVNPEAALYQEEFLDSAISFSEDDFDLEIDPHRHSHHDALATGGAGILSEELEFDEDERLTEMDSPARRFYLARQRDLRSSGEFSDEEESVYDENELEVPPMAFAGLNIGGRRPLSLDVPDEASGFFDDDDDDGEDQDDDELFEVYEQSRPGRFPRPNLSAVTEESMPYTGKEFSSAVQMPVRPPPQL